MQNHVSLEPACMRDSGGGHARMAELKQLVVQVFKECYGHHMGYVQCGAEHGMLHASTHAQENGILRRSKSIRKPIVIAGWL